MHGPVPKEQMPEYYAQYDAAIVPLAVPIYGAFPSKVYDVLPFGLPVLFCGTGEGADFVIKHNVGYVANSGDHGALAENIAILDKHTVLYRNEAGSGSLENAKDKYPEAQLVAREMLFEKLTELGLYDTLKQTFISTVINSYYYHLRSFSTGAAFEATFNHFRDVAIEKYGIDMSDARYFHVPVEYRYMKAVADAKSSTDFVYFMYMEERERAKHREAVESGAAHIGEASEIRKSWSYKIGRFVTWLPRKLRIFFRSWRDRGFRYTMSRVFQKLSSVFKKKD